MSIWAIILAAGKGHRAGGKTPKQYQPLGGGPMLRQTLRAFLNHPEISGVQVVYNPADDKLYKRAVEGLTLPDPVKGGKTRQESVLCGLEALEGQEPDFVLIHDAARAYVTKALIDRVIERLKTAKSGVIPVLPVPDTVKHQEKGFIKGTIDRAPLVLAQTPQGFPYPAILKAHKKARGLALTDDAAVFENAGLTVTTVPGERTNIKITFEEDFMASISEVRTGSGFDVHAFEKGDHVILCGIKIPHHKGLKGHSDADAGLHAITDAVLGAISAGDIGDHFPPSDDKWKDAPSDIFLKKAVELVETKGGRIASIDLTLICETPKIGPFRDKMRQRVAEVTGLEKERISIKATTTEKLGFPGRGEGIAAQALATVVF